MEEIAVLKACLVRPTVNQPWGFRLRGGADFGQPIRINAVVAGSPAAVIGLEADDEVTEIGGEPTASMTHAQVLDAIGRQTGEKLYLTIERKARGSEPQGPDVGQTQSPKNYETQDNVTGSQGRTTKTPFEFQTVQSRPFVEPVNQRRPPSQPVTAPPQTLPADTDGGSFEQSEYSTQLRNDVNEVPQSRTFKILESIMSNEEPSAGASGLPPPRSAAMEKMKREGSSGAGSSPRVKVLMSQKYNSPLGMYSAKNLIETFAVQAENALETLEKQNPALPEHEPVYASQH